MKKMKKLLLLLLTLLLCAALTAGCTRAEKLGELPLEVYEQLCAEHDAAENPAPEKQAQGVQKGQAYSDRDSVAAYLRAYGELPPNYITKKEAEALGWVSSKGNLWTVAPGKSIGGDVFGNREKLLPTKKGRKWYECDIDFDGKYRNAKRIIFSSDGLIYYTDDHYATFTEMKDDGA